MRCIKWHSLLKVAFNTATTAALTALSSFPWPPVLKTRLLEYASLRYLATSPNNEDSRRFPFGRVSTEGCWSLLKKKLGLSRDRREVPNPHTSSFPSACQECVSHLGALGSSCRLLLYPPFAWRSLGLPGGRLISPFPYREDKLTVRHYFSGLLFLISFTMDWCVLATG